MLSQRKCCYRFLNNKSYFLLVLKNFIQGCLFTWKPENTWKNLEFDNLDKLEKTGKTWNFQQFLHILKN